MAAQSRAPPYSPSHAEAAQTSSPFLLTGLNATASLAPSPPSVPSFMQPNASWLLPAYANSEMEVIQSTFSKSSFRTLHALPSQIRLNQVNQSVAVHRSENLTQPLMINPHNTYKRLTKQSTFSDFQHISNPDSLIDQLISSTRLADEEKRRAISSRDFRFSSVKPQELLPVRYDEEKSYDKSYNAHIEAERERARQEREKIHSGPFYSCGGPAPQLLEGGISKNYYKLPSRTQIHDIVDGIDREISQDWSREQYSIYIDQEDYIIIRFSQDSIENLHGLNMYMQQYMKYSRTVIEYSLNRLIPVWNRIETENHSSTWIYYGILPPWIMKTNREIFYLLHPEKRLYKIEKQYQQQNHHQNGQLQGNSFLESEETHRQEMEEIEQLQQKIINSNNNNQQQNGQGNLSSSYHHQQQQQQSGQSTTINLPISKN